MRTAAVLFVLVSTAALCVVATNGACGGIAQPPLASVAPARDKAPDAPALAARSAADEATPPIASANPAESLDTGIEEEEWDVLDQRASRRRQRPFASLVIEIQQIERSFPPTGAAQALLPHLLRRLAEDYVELENAASRGSDTRTALRARKAAMKYYEILVERLLGSTLAGGPLSYGLLDEAQYYFALELVRDGSPAPAGNACHDLVTRSPASRWVPYASYVSGALYAKEAVTDPSKRELARQAFAKAAEGPDARLTALAQRRLVSAVR